ncbi:FISUMP domain-containing protein [Bacteroidota bacterium]
MKNSIIYFRIIIIILGLLICSCNKIKDPKYGLFTDQRDCETYKTVQIGNQVWMAENLRYKAYTRDYCPYNDDESYIYPYGYLYDWETACIVCPPGWHLPSWGEWTELIDYLGGEKIAGGKMKEKGKGLWVSPNTGATNESGFSALPGGLRNPIIWDGGYFDLGIRAWFWTSREEIWDYVWVILLGNNYDIVKIIDNMVIKKYAISVRCVKD